MLREQALGLGLALRQVQGVAWRGHPWLCARRSPSSVAGVLGGMVGAPMRSVPPTGCCGVRWAARRLQVGAVWAWHSCLQMVMWAFERLMEAASLAGGVVLLTGTALMTLLMPPQ